MPYDGKAATSEKNIVKPYKTSILVRYGHPVKTLRKLLEVRRSSFHALNLGFRALGCQLTPVKLNPESAIPLN